MQFMVAVVTLAVVVRVAGVVVVMLKLKLGCSPTVSLSTISRA
jgi:hypothetical protein